MKARKGSWPRLVLAILLVLLIVRLGGSASPVAIGGIDLKTPNGHNPMERIPAGGRAWLRVEVQREPPDLPLEYRWKVGEGGIMDTPSLKEPAGFYTAPTTPGYTTVTLVVLLKGKAIAQKSFPLEIVGAGAAPTEGTAHGQPVEPPPAGPTPAPSSPVLPPEPELKAVSISSPTGGTAVGQVITVTGRVRELNPGEHLVLLVRPVPDSPTYRWEVQPPPDLREDIWSSQPVFIGLTDDPAGLPFRLCAVITPQPEPRGAQRPALPPGPSYCIDVRRSPS